MQNLLHVALDIGDRSAVRSAYGVVSGEWSASFHFLLSPHYFLRRQAAVSGNQKELRSSTCPDSRLESSRS
jgi:hypothetical protein